MDLKRTICTCSCGAQQFQVRLFRSEQVGLLTCSEGHHSLLLDSRDYWADVLQNGRPKLRRCRCGQGLFGLELIYEFRESGDVRRVEVISNCANCGRGQRPTLFEFKYSPTDELISRPLDPIERPWLQPKRRQITAYWRPEDAERFARYLAEELGARVFQRIRGGEIQPCRIEDVEFFPELKPELFFTNVAEIAPPRIHDPEKASAFIRLSGPYHILIAFPNDLAFLYYIKYADETMSDSKVIKQPALFAEFTRTAREWLSQHYLADRSKNSADNPKEYVRVFEHSKFRC